MTALSVVIPAHDEADRIDACLGAVLASDTPAASVLTVVVANACADGTAEKARAWTGPFAARGWDLLVIERPEPGKTGAMNAADGAIATRGEADGIRVYLDADVTVHRRLLHALARVLHTDQPRFASGTPHVTHGDAHLTRAYARFWSILPFVSRGAHGFGAFAVNAAGRARWDDWPDVILEDVFARLHFTPEERELVGAGYDWPLVEGFANLVRTRRRQKEGEAQIRRDYPELLKNDDRHGSGTGDVAAQCMCDPVSAMAYAAVSAAVRLPILKGGDKTKPDGKDVQEGS